jgi:hypothetical protein
MRVERNISPGAWRKHAFCFAPSKSERTINIPLLAPTMAANPPIRQVHCCAQRATLEHKTRTFTGNKFLANNKRETNAEEDCRCGRGRFKWDTWGWMNEWLQRCVQRKYWRSSLLHPAVAGESILTRRKFPSPPKKSRLFNTRQEPLFDQSIQLQIIKKV